MILENVPYSFVKMTEGDPGAAPCLESSYPVALPADVRFQFILKPEITAETDFLEGDNSIFIKPGDGALIECTELFGRVYLGDDRYLFYLPETVTEIEDLTNGVCFTFVFNGDGSVDSPVYISDCFVKRSDVAYTTLLQYSNPVNQNGFIYCDIVGGYQNSIRLPMVKVEITFEGERNIYRFSNGRQKKTAERINKIISFQTDFINESAVDALQAALTSGYVFVDTDGYTGEIVANDVVTPEYNRDALSTWNTPRALFTAYASPYDMQLNTCAECQ